MGRSEDRSWLTDANSGGFNYRNKYQPLLSRRYYFEKRYFNQGERLSWSHHRSFAILGYDSEIIHFLNDVYGYLARCFGMEMIDTHAYSLASNKDLHQMSIKPQLEKIGYYYGSFPLQYLNLLGQDIKKVLFIQHPFKTLIQDFKAGGQKDLNVFLADEKNWKIFETIAELRDNDDCMIIRMEECYHDSIGILVDTMLYLCGHEPYALIKYAAENILLSKGMANFDKTNNFDLMDTELCRKVYMKNQPLLDALGYNEKGLRDEKTYHSSLLQRMI